MDFQEYPIALVLFVSALSGCSGGGNGSATSSPGFTGFSQVAANGVAPLTGQAVIGDFTYDAATAEGSLRNVARAPADIAAVYQDGQLVALRGTVGGRAFDIDSRTGGTIESDGVTIFAEDTATQTVVTYIDPFFDGFEYQTLGYWSQGESAGPFASVSVGGPTPVTDLPAATAVYTGFARGLRAGDDGVHVTVADATVRTDFATATLSTTNTTMTALGDGSSSQAPEHDMSGTLQVTGAGLSGTVASAAGSGTASGSFFGPRAAEVGGTYELSGPGGVHAGAFGARR